MLKQKAPKKEYSTPHPKQRTLPQNNALWLFYERLAKVLNEAGLEMRVLLKPEINIWWTKDSIHDYLWLPIQKVMFGTNSTTFLHKQEQIEKIHSIIMRELGEKHNVEYIPFPTSLVDKETAPLR